MTYGPEIGIILVAIAVLVCGLIDLLKTDD